MQGYFDSDGNPKVLLEIEGTKSAHIVKIPALFDTGHNGSLSLTVLQLIEIGAVLATTGIVEYANGQKGAVLYFNVKVRIDGEIKEVLASMIENPDSDEAIAGLELFTPYVSVIDFVDKKIAFMKKEDFEKLGTKKK